MVESRVAGRGSLSGNGGGSGEGRGQSRLALLEGSPLLIQRVEATAGVGRLVSETVPVLLELQESGPCCGNPDLLHQQRGGGDQGHNAGVAQRRSGPPPVPRRGHESRRCHRTQMGKDRGRDRGGLAGGDDRGGVRADGGCECGGGGGDAATFEQASKPFEMMSWARWLSPWTLRMAVPWTKGRWSAIRRPNAGSDREATNSLR